VGEPDGYDDGTLAPTAAISSMPFAPEICVPAALALHRQYGARLYGEYGFHDSFNLSFRDTSVRAETGSVDAGAGWVARRLARPRSRAYLRHARQLPERGRVARDAQMPPRISSVG